MASRVEKRTARALLFFKMDRLAMVMSALFRQAAELQEDRDLTI